MPPRDCAREQVLSGGGVTHVVRVGETVRRPARPFSATVQHFLAHLRRQGFLAAPEPLGYDECGREILSYLPGDVPVEPLPAYAAEQRVLVALGGLVRQLHDAAASWVPPKDAVYGALPGPPPPGVRPLVEHPELVSHQDYCPGNIVFRNGLPAGLIDFDMARPTSRVADVVNALYYWAPLSHPQDRAPSLADADPGVRARIFADAYGMTAAQRAAVAPLAVRRAANSVFAMQAAAEADPVFRRWWEEGLRERLPRTQAWITAEAEHLAAALR